jgi:hypothetical protein
MSKTGTVILNDGLRRIRAALGSPETLEARASRLSEDLSRLLAEYEKCVPSLDIAEINLAQAKRVEEEAVNSQEMSDDDVRSAIGLHTRARNVFEQQSAGLLKISPQLDEAVFHFHGVLYQLHLAEMDRVRASVRRDIVVAGKVSTDTVPARAALDGLVRYSDPVIEMAECAPPEIQNMWKGRPGYWPKGTRDSADFAHCLLHRYGRLCELSERKSSKS